MSTPELHLQTLFLLDPNGRIIGTREPEPTAGPKFILVRGRSSCAWAVRADISKTVADEFDRLAQEESTVTDFRRGPVNATRYLSLVDGEILSGPAFEFPEMVARSEGTVLVEDVRMLERHFSGWHASEIEACSPIIGLVEDDEVLSVCFSARRSEIAAEAGVETAVEFRGRGFAGRVVSSWALKVRQSGRVPLYSTSWDNAASLAVAQKLGLVPYASSWSVA